MRPADDLNHRVFELHRRHRSVAEAEITRYYVPGRGYVADEPTAVERDQFGLCVTLVNGETHGAGDYEIPFALQSISKVFAYALALADRGSHEVLSRVGVEPSGDAYNSLIFDEYNRRPFNPMVNAGALATTGLVEGRSADEKLERLLALLRACAGNDSLAVDGVTFDAEFSGADRNRATAYLMRSDGMLSGDVESTLALYLRQCSVHVTSRDLANMGATLAAGGVNPISGRQVLPRRAVRDVLSVMYTCGMYDFAGEWAFSIGVPAKSGVSGGLLAVIPQKMGVGVFSPGLDRFGNSVRATRVCEELSDELGLHLLATEAEDSLLNLPPSDQTS